MSRESTDELERPYTHAVRIEQAMATLDYLEMIALAELFEDWAFNEPSLADDQRTMFLQWSADYERISAFCGEGWKASGEEAPNGLIAFIARRALAHPAKEEFQ